MIVDSSAIVAIALNEPEARRMSDAIVSAQNRRMSAVNWLETLMVVESRLGAEAARDVRFIMAELEIDVVPFDRDHMVEAHGAWQRFGKGRHKAALNLADCCAYATAVIASDELLYKGNDFPQTDIPAAAW